jgi:hypothetical protein
MYPDFIGIGAQKSGTTWLYHNLRVHPQLYVPRKEVHYFDKKIHEKFNLRVRIFGKSPEDQRWRRQFRHLITAHLVKKPSPANLLRDLRYYLMPPGDEWYASIFKPKKGEVAGEITPAYSIIGREMVARVHELMPEAKIIFLIRNPIERDWSQTVMNFDNVEKGSVRSIPEEELLRRFRNRGRILTDYLRTLENWGSYYPEEQIFIGFLEDIHFLPEDILRRVYGFLNVSPDFKPCMANERIHSRSVGEIPTGLATRLAETYHEEIECLHERFGGYASFWLFCTDRLMNDPPSEDYLPYPLWESSLWSEWLNEGDVSGAGQLWSGPLSSFRAVI